MDSEKIPASADFGKITKKKNQLWLWIVFGILFIVLIGTIFYGQRNGLTWSDVKEIMNNGPVSVSTTEVNVFESNSTTAPAATSTSSTSASTATAPVTTADWKAYTNADYGFHLTFTDPWQGYKFKKVPITGTVATYYVNVPTTDPFYQTATEHSDAGYAAPFAISVINKAEWTGSHEQMIDFGSKIAENANYVFTYGQWQAAPTDIGEIIGNSIKTVIDSFTL